MHTRKNGIAPLLIVFIVVGITVMGAGYFFISRPDDIPKKSSYEAPQLKPSAENISPQELLSDQDTFFVSPATSPSAATHAGDEQGKSVRPPVIKSPLPLPLPAPPSSSTAGHVIDTQSTKTNPPAPAFFRQAPEIPTSAEQSKLPDCASAVFSFAPVDLYKLMSIAPLGNLAPPGHTFPTEHMFFHITAGGVTTNTIPLAAPGDAYITLISLGRGLTQDPVDYTIFFAPCKDVIAYYNHVKSISPELEKIVAASPCAFSGESKETRCNIITLTPVAKGAYIGEVGRLQGNFDLGLIDLRKTHSFANQSRYGARSPYIQCPLDYFNDAAKSLLYALLSRQDKYCGTIAQDIPGTLKGNWFFGNARADSGSDWDKYLAFVDDNQRADISVVSVGGIFTTAGKWEFSPQKNGSINRAFADVVPDGTIYCYESQSMAGRLLTRLESVTKLTIERQEGNCEQAALFVDPTTYTR